MSKATQFGLLLAAMVIFATQPGASCVSDSDSDRSQPTRYEPTRSDREDDRDYIPQRADIVAEGKNELRYAADADGEVFVQDLRDEKKVFQRRITRGSVIRVSPNDDRIWIDDRTVSKDDLKRDNTHRIYLMRDRRFEDDRRDDRRNDRDDRRNDRSDSRSDRDELPRGVPSGAQLMDEGANKEISFHPSVNGKAYIYDPDARRVIDTVDLKAKQRFVFSPGAGRVSVDGKRVIERRFDTRVKYRIYFAR